MVSSHLLVNPQTINRQAITRTVVEVTANIGSVRMGTMGERKTGVVRETE